MNTPKTILEFKNELSKTIPSAKLNVDAPAAIDGEWWLDLHVEGRSFQISWREVAGFGLYVGDSAYGERPTELYRTPELLVRRLLTLEQSVRAGVSPALSAAAQIRHLAGVSQMDVANHLCVKQPSISRLESRQDMLLGSLASYMEALGARLELRIVSDEFNVPLHLFPSTHEMLWGDQLPMLRPSAAVVPFFSLLVIRVIDVNEVRKFYEVAGLRFISERHGTGPEHYAASNFGQTFEIYPAKTASDVTNNVRLGFLVSSLAETAHSLKMHYPDLTGNQQDSGYGRFVSAKDPAGTKVDFYENASGSDQTQLAVAN